MRTNDIIFKNDEEIRREVRRFKRYLRKEDVADNTIISYTGTLEYFLTTYRHVTSDTTAAYKAYLLETCKPSTANQRMQAMNKYFKWNNMKFHLKSVKIQQKPFLDNVISMPDYKFLKRKLKREEDLTYYYLVWGLACTGARISEALTFKVEHINDGYTDFYGKGKKYRRIYFVKAYQKEVSKWLESIGRKEGYIFISNTTGNPLNSKAVEKQLKCFAKRYGIDPKVMYPHSFRHLFGKTFFERYNDLFLLSDIMGHASIETTRIYARRTSTEQAQVINSVVNW